MKQEVKKVRNEFLRLQRAFRKEAKMRARTLKYDEALVDITRSDTYGHCAHMLNRILEGIK
jgi:predicted secreted protein